MIVLDEAQERLIPACAGKTFNCALILLCTTAHPRVCGENDYPEETTHASMGSSPRVRGKQTKLYLSTGSVRLIPACAGKTYR